MALVGKLPYFLDNSLNFQVKRNKRFFFWRNQIKKNRSNFKRKKSFQVSISNNDAYISLKFLPLLCTSLQLWVPISFQNVELYLFLKIEPASFHDKCYLTNKCVEIPKKKWQQALHIASIDRQKGTAKKRDSSFAIECQKLRIWVLKCRSRNCVAVVIRCWPLWFLRFQSGRLKINGIEFRMK